MKTPSKTTDELAELEGAISVDPENHLRLSTEIGSASTTDQTVAQIRLVWENRRFLGRVAGIGFLASVVVALLIPVRYQSTARLMPPDNQSGGGLSMAMAALSGSGAANLGGLGGLGGLAGEMLGLKSSSDLLVGVLNSRTVADSIIHQFDLQKVYGTRRIEDARKTLAARTDASIDRKSQIVTITITDHDPRRAAGIAQAYVEELNKVLADVSTSSARRERIFLEGRLQTVSKELEDAEKQFSEYASRNSAIDVPAQGKAMVDAAARLQGELIAVRSELEGLRQIYTDNNIRVRTLQARAAELENEIQKVGGKGESTSLDTAKTDDSLYPSIRRLPLLGVGYADFYRKTKIDEAVFAALTQEYEMAKVQEAKEIPTAKVLDPPNVPDKKSFPPRTLLVLLGTMLAFSLGVMWIFGDEAWKAVDPADPRKILILEILGSTRAAIPWGRKAVGRKQ